MIPRATYRFQFHRDFPFAKAEALVPYLDRLGISHVYASPVTTARSGSLHGYDVVDPTRINPELGGEEALRSLVAALRERGMGLVIDIVPNHMGVAGGENAWWNDVLAHGPDSAFASYFDIDWSRKLLLPILGAPLGQVLRDGQVAVSQDRGTPELLVYGEHRVPLRPETHDNLPESGGSDGLAALVEAQHYQLAWWRTADDAINWRRFFTINDLAGLRVEDGEVFEATHALYFRLWREGLIDGVRIDHVDGLTDPEAYLQRLRARFEAIERPAGAPPGPAFVVVEKILGPGELLPAGWPIEGTSGYDFMDQASAVLHDPAGEESLTRLWREFSGRSGDFHAEELTARRQLLDWSFQAQLGDCVDAFARLAASAPETACWTRPMLRRALERLLWVFPVYRTYGTGSTAPPEDAPVRQRVREAVMPFIPPGEANVTDMILSWLAGEGSGKRDLAADAVRRFQQLSAPIAAKAVEDTAFYRHGTLLSRLDVGFDANCFAMNASQFLDHAAQRAERHPQAMLATATHDHKRGEDVRARLSLLSHIPSEWADVVRSWDRMADGERSGMHPADRYLAYQTLYGTFPDEPASGEASGSDYAARLREWQTKALREAKLRSSWSEPDEAYEQLCGAFIEKLCDSRGQVAESVAAFVGQTRSATLAAMLGQVALRCLLPGVPDLYQGGELPDLSLVDPDNRRPVDYARREAMLEGHQPLHPKLSVLREALDHRRKAPDLCAHGALVPAAVSGERRSNVLTFTRRHGGAFLNCAVLINAGAALFSRPEPRLPDEWWGDTAIAFDGASDKPRPACEVFAQGPVFMSAGGSGSTLGNGN